MANAAEICVHQKLKEWRMVNILFYKDVLRAAAKVRVVESGTRANAGAAGELQSVQTRDTLGSIAFQPLPQHETLADLQHNLP